ncbi:MAG: multicopper oxidase domain-containing protein, partial [Desulfobacterales bacterium]
MSRSGLTRRNFIKGAGAGLFLAGVPMSWPLPAWAKSPDTGINAIRPQTRYDLTIGYSPIRIDGKKGISTGINGSVPGPMVRLREGDDVVLNVTNDLHDTAHSSIHWHGILVPFPMDGVPGVNFAGIGPGETYQYSYHVRQAGTYWYHLSVQVRPLLSELIPVNLRVGVDHQCIVRQRDTCRNQQADRDNQQQAAPPARIPSHWDVLLCSALYCCMQLLNTLRGILRNHQQ